MRFLNVLFVIVLVLGLSYWSGIDSLEGIFLFSGVVSLILATIFIRIKSKDYLNPINILVISAALRLGVPGILWIWSKPPLNTEWFNLPDIYWHMGRVLAVIGLVSIVLGWSLVPKKLSFFAQTITYRLTRRMIFDQRKGAIAVITMGAGIVFVIIFMRLNFASASDAIADGMIRNQQNRVANTSRYSFFGYWFLLSGATLLSAYLISFRKVNWRYGIIPGLIVLLVFSPFGQRVGALTAIGYTLIMIWYSKDYEKVGMFKFLKPIFLAAPLVLLYSEFMVYYRDSGISSGVSVLNFQGILEYITYTLWFETGTLHPYVYATYFDAGILQGKTYPLIFGFITEVWMGFQGIRPGAFMVDRLIQPGGTWGFHTGIIVDVYMNSGILAVILSCMFFGALTRIIYDSFVINKGNSLVMVFYVLYLWQFVWIFYESILNIFPLILANLFIILMFIVSKILPNNKFGSRNLVPKWR